MYLKLIKLMRYGNVKLNTHIHLVQRSKNEWNYTSAPPLRLHGVVFSYKEKHRDKFTFTFYL